MDLWRVIRNQWDRTAAIVAAILGVIAVLLGWLGVSGKSLPAAQIPYLASGAVLGVVLVAIAATLWISADLRDEWAKLDEIHRSVTEAVQAQAAARVATGHSSTATDTAVPNGEADAKPTPRKRAIARKTARRAGTRT